MVPEKFDRERGQILVQVAIMAGVLFAFVALAVDAGQVYGGRRRMQNAADAGALAGAREICEGGYSTFLEARAEAEAVALEYATNYNSAQAATVGFRDDYTVVVTATQTLDTFFAGVIGIPEANVRAQAAARCSGSGGAGGLWPLAFNFDRYVDEIGCDQEFYVFSADDLKDIAHDCCDCDAETVDPDCDEEEVAWNQDCKNKLDLTAIGAHFSTSSRGWLLFKMPEDPYSIPGECSPSMTADPCGNAPVACWLAEDYPEAIPIDSCIPGQEGLSWGVDVRDGAKSREGDVVEVVLWDRACYDGSEDDPEKLGSCPGTPYVYHVAGFGCVRIEYVYEQEGPGYENEEFALCGGGTTDMKYIKATTICEGEDPDYESGCSGGTGTGSGELPQEWETRRVSLVE